jgi:excinuclease UvrABC nuclease subunit
MRTVFPHTLVVKKLEGVSKLIFRNYYKQITELIGNSHGIYALYDENELYYVGKSTDLKNRVKQHLKDRHLASWTHFSLYLVRKADHINEIESLIIRIANPKGNTKKYSADKGTSLLKQLQALVKQRQQLEFNTMFGTTTDKRALRTTRQDVLT